MRLGLAFLLLVVLASPVHAQLSTGATISFDEFRIEVDGEFIIPETEEDQRFYLNSATCECSRMNAEATTIVYNMGVEGTGPVTPAEIWVGTGCDMEATRMMTCRKLGSTVANIYDFDTTRDDIEVGLYDLVNSRPGDEDSDCKALVASTLWVLIDEGTNGSYELIESIGVGTTDMSMPTNGGVDTTAPTLPENILANASEEAIRITWDVALTDQGIFGYQAFCAQAGVPVFSAAQRESPKYRTAGLVCGASVEADLTESPVATNDAGEVLTEPLSAFRNLDETFLCGEAISPTANSLTIQGLENDVPYEVALVVIDDHGNYTGTWFTSTVLPKSVTDLWEDIDDRGGGIEGGCLGTSLPGDGGPFGGLLVGGALLIGMKMRRRRTVLAAGAVVATLAGTAAADDFRPYWEEEVRDDGTNLYDLDDVRWHVGIKVGPYIPGIDDQVGRNAMTGLGPYEAMFGDWYDIQEGTGKLDAHNARVWQILPMLDVDYVLWRGFGQLTIGGSIGYMQKSAPAYLAGTSPDEPKRLRSPTNETVFRLIPTQANVGYRFTYLADTYGVPIVPFLRGGLAYYMWMMKAPNGEPSKIGTMNEAKGGSFGFVGSIGLAIRAEGIDRDSARSMRETGVDHAGFYVEWSLGKVDGFGASDKLSVGDSTFFGGFDFEF